MMSFISNVAFIPKDNVSRTFLKQTGYIYPKSEYAMSQAEKSCAYVVTKAALEATATIPYHQKLHILASST